MKSHLRGSHHTVFCAAIGAAGMLLAAPLPAAAAHRARMSADLSDHLAVGSQTIDVIVHGDAAETNALATRYNVRVKKQLKGAVVLQLTAGQLDALSRDEAVDHLSGDLRIQSSTIEVTARSEEHTSELQSLRHLVCR